MTAVRILCLVLLIAVVGLTEAQDGAVWRNKDRYDYEQPPYDEEGVDNYGRSMEHKSKKKTYETRMEIDPETGNVIYVLVPVEESDDTDKVHFFNDSEERNNDIKEQIAAYEEQQRKKQKINVEGSTIDPKQLIDTPGNNNCPAGYKPDPKGVCRNLWRMAYMEE